MQIQRPANPRGASRKWAAAARARPAGAQSNQRALVQRDQFVPRALRLWFVVDGISRLQRHVPDAPAMQRAWVDFDFRRTLGCVKRFIQFGLRVRLFLVVVGGDPEVKLSLDLRNEQMRT